MSSQRLLTTEELLDRLQLNLRTVYRLIKAGKLPAIRVGRQWRFRAQDVDDWMAKGGTVSSEAEEAKVPGSCRVLVVDDEDAVLRAMMSHLSRTGYEVHGADGGEAALAQLQRGSFDLLITDLMMPGMNGLGLIRRARELHAALPIIIITGYSTEAMAIEAVNLGVSGYLRKPVRAPQLQAAAAKAIGLVTPPHGIPAIETHAFRPE